ncbi:YciI family protein [Thalassotalea castellviae]|uniref:YciI family protein n=1 Tax=Thalassotalea castellviae TaxID=3075612 RepID=A0ABU3A2R2_9GAMM|nr:YciI family protein [Thalassotalea sp. W431]MDT0604230.1 YciI family protein [Thalassotalea sp. W431]
MSLKSLVLMLFIASCFPAFAEQENPQYDAKLAAKYGGDEYGMKSYVLVMLKSGTNTTETQDKITELFRAHLANIRKLVDQKKLIVAGPFEQNDKSYRGLFILDVANIEEAEALMQTDPAINAKLLAAELYPWYGSAALAAYLEDSDKIWQKRP